MVFKDFTKIIDENLLTEKSIVRCPLCNIKISIAGLKKRIERVKAESELLSGQDFGFEGLDKPDEIARSCCINPECKGVGYVIV